MSRWICIDDICIPSDENDWEELVAFADAIAEQEPIDIVRCRECKHYEDPDHKIFENCVKWKDSNGIILPMKPNDSCSYGERVDEYEKEYRELGLGKLKALRQAERSSE